MFRIGVDVGGTNTDCAILDVSKSDSASRGVLISAKKPTTRDITTGITQVIEEALRISKVIKQDILSVSIGTTHFVNAVVEADATRLSKVAVVRLCGPATRVVEPFATFPSALKNIVKGPIYFLDGGLEIDGREILPLNVQQIQQTTADLLSHGITKVALVGVFSPLDHAGVHEKKCKEIILGVDPSLDIVCSHEIGGVGLLERENATILNAAILQTAKKTVQGFQRAMYNLDLKCSLYLTQNDGTLTNAANAISLPIKTFASGPTNSAIGAAFLAGIDRQHDNNGQVLVVDIGGTTTDICALLPSGFPRQAPNFVEVGGVRTAFSMPDVYSVGLGGGSIIEIDETLTVGPTSVGHELTSKSRSFGGKVLTATDIAVAAGETILGIQPVQLPPKVILDAKSKIKKILQQAIDSMKVSAAPATILLVGGGSIVYMDEVDGVRDRIIPPHHDSANAVGAAIAKVGGEVDTIEILEGRDEKEVLKEAEKAAIQNAIDRGADPEDVKIVEIEKLPLQYVTNKATRLRVKAVGRLLPQAGSDLVAEEPLKPSDDQADEFPSHETTPKDFQYETTSIPQQPSDIDISSYRPRVKDDTWYLSEIDLAFIASGTGVLGTGGGGSSYISYLMSVDALRKGGSDSMKIISPKSLKNDDVIALGSWYGAPSVSSERLPSGTEIPTGIDAVNKVLGIKDFQGLLTLEIGGGNGLATFPTSVHYGQPTVDGDMMGRAYPSGEHALAYVYGEKVTPCAMADIKGNVSVVVHAESSARLEKMMRSTCIELGLSTSAVAAPLKGAAIKNFAIPNTISQAWYLGRAVHQARKTKTDFTKAIFDVVPGKVLYTGKIVDVSRDVSRGYTVGRCLIAPQSLDGTEDAKDGKHLIIPFQNEYLYAAFTDKEGIKEEEVLCTVPDLISILGEDGEAIGSQDLRYGLRVVVIGMPAHPLWTENEKALKIGGPEYFGLEMKWTSIGKYEAPRSVIDEFR